MNERRTDLQADRALGALEGDEERELEQLLAGQSPAGGAAETEREGFECAAAALDLAFAASREPRPEALPTHLRASVLAAVRSAQAGTSGPETPLPRIERLSPEQPRRSWLQPAGWFAAAAAAGLALYFALDGSSSNTALGNVQAELAEARSEAQGLGADLQDALSERDAERRRAESLALQLETTIGELDTVNAELAAAAERHGDELFALTEERDSLAFAVDALRLRVGQLETELLGPDPRSDRQQHLERGGLTLDWTALEDPRVADAGVSGDVVWDPATGSGYMRFAGLPANDPSREQYQLWIFDSTISDETPIDGGVFDISATGEALVRIDPKIEVTDATMFAITLERPGGVVVSDRSRLLLLAQRG